MTSALCRSATPHPRACADAGVRFGADQLSAQRVPIHYEHDDEHIVLITIDRPEAKNSPDLEHFSCLREAWERFDADDDAWVAIITGVGDAFFTGADLKTYIPEITELRRSRSPTAGRHRDRRVPARRRHQGGAARRQDLQADHRRGQRLLRRRRHGDARRVDIRVACPEATFGVMEPKRGLFAGGGTTVRLPRQIPFPQAMEFLLCADLIPADRGARDGPAQRGRARGRAARHGLRVRPPHHAPTRRSRSRRRRRACWEGLGMNLAEAYRNEIRDQLRRSSPPRTPRRGRRRSPRSARRTGRVA